MSASTKPQPPPKPPSLIESSYPVYQGKTKTSKLTKVENKRLEELVLDELYYDIVNNLPADDIAVLMDEDKLLTMRQRDHYRMMKANHQPDVEKSEYLMECLRKAEPGFLQRLCNILKTLPPSSYIADKIQEKIQEMSLRPPMLNPQRSKDNKSKQVKSSVQWKTEYRKLEVKSRMQLQAKDKEIKRLRKIIRQLQMENYEYLDQLFTEMRSQVENVSKWIDLKSKTGPSSHSLVKLALGRERSYRDLYGSRESLLSTSCSSSNHSTMERRPERKVSLESSYRDGMVTPFSRESRVATPTETRNYHSLDDCSDLLLYVFAKSVSNPPSSLESDISDITRPIRVHSPLSRLDSNESDFYVVDALSPRESQAEFEYSDQKSTLAKAYIHASDANLSSTTKNTARIEPSPNMETHGHSSALVGMAIVATMETHTPSIARLNAGCSQLSLHDRDSQSHQKYIDRNESKVGHDMEPMADLKTVFKRIQGKDFITSVIREN